MELRAVVYVLERIAPTAHAETWDNVGLLCGDPSQPVARALLTIDCTRAVVDEAERIGASLIVSYHPPIFEDLKRIKAGSVPFEAIRRGIAIFSPHTALDVAEGGTNDVLADALGMTERKPLRLSASKDSLYKLVTFVPVAAVEKVSRAVFDAGAGKIGDYSSCSFRMQGTGTFFGEEGTNPVVGQAGKLEEAQEIRLETVVPIARVSEIVAALRASHPYEEPAFDLMRLAPPPEGPGIGRIGTVSGTRGALVDRLKKALDLGHALVAGDLDRNATRAAVCAGAGGELLKDALSQKAELFVTGELRHHDALKAMAAGATVVTLRHTASERCTLPHLRDRLGRELPDLKVSISTEDREPFVPR
ncbi:MAG: Nif3-like dinuclear metal center hexameric protein [Polyangiales bacterium]